MHEIFRMVLPSALLPPPPSRPRDTVHPRKLVSYWLNITMNGLISIVPRHGPGYALGCLSIKACVRNVCRAFARVRAYHSPFDYFIRFTEIFHLISEKRGNFFQFENVPNEAEQTREDRSRKIRDCLLLSFPSKRNPKYRYEHAERWKLRLTGLENDSFGGGKYEGAKGQLKITKMHWGLHEIWKSLKSPRRRKISN